MESPAGEGAAPLPAADLAAPTDTPDTTPAASSAAAPERQPDDDPRALPPAWRDPAAPADAPADPLPFIGATPATHRGLLVHAPAVVGLVLALLRDEPALATALFDATWSPDDPLRAQLHDRTARLTRWVDATILAPEAPDAVEDHAWRDRIVELSDLLLPMLPLLFTPELVEAELQMDADLSTAGALRKLTAFARTAPQPAPILAPMVIAALIGIRPAADLADQLAMPGADERQLLRRLQERYDGWEAPTWTAIIRVTAAAWREASPWRRLLLHAQLDRLRYAGMAAPEPVPADDPAAPAAEVPTADPRLAAELEEARRALARTESELNMARTAAAELPALRRQLDEGRIRQQRIADRRDLLEQRLAATEEELRQLRQSLAAAEHERDHWRRTATGEPAEDEADDDPVPVMVPDAPPVPADLLAGYRVALFTGHENAGVRAKMLATLRAIGAGEDAQVHLIRGATRGRAQYGAGDLVLVDCRFVSHKETELLETRVGPDALLLNLHRGTGGLQAELGSRLARTAEGRLVLRR